MDPMSDALFLHAMREKGGSIINVSSRAGVLGFEKETAYCASKFGIEGLTRALAADLKGTRVSVNTITPGAPRRAPQVPVSWRHSLGPSLAFQLLAQLVRLEALSRRIAPGKC